MEDLQHDFDAIEFKGNHFLAGLAEQYGAEAIRTASLTALGYPAHIVTSHTEAKQIFQHLKSQEK